MECKNARLNDKRARRRKKSFTEALKEKYCVEDEETFDFIIISPKRKSNAAELAHLQTVVLNEMNVTRADIPHQGLSSLCPNVVDLDLANNLLEKWSELLEILFHLPKVKFVNVSFNKLRLETNDSLPNTKLNVENLALNYTGATIEEVVRLSQIMPALKELHLCGNNYENLSNIEQNIQDGAFSCLECLRLNNNEISRWSEFWKLRHLPHLKFLIISGNPVSNIFYEAEEIVEKTSTENIVFTSNTAGSSLRDAQLTDKSVSSSVQNLHADVVLKKPHHKENGENELNCMDVNGDYNHMLIDHLLNSDEEEQEIEVYEDEDDNDDDDDDDDDRPHSMFGHHVGSDSSNSDQERTSSEGDSSLPKNLSISSAACDDGRGQSSINFNKCLNTNFNNSRRQDGRKTLFDSDESNGYGLFGPFGDNLIDSENIDGENNEDDLQDELEDWHRIAAETFLYDIIGSINFNDEPLGLISPAQSIRATKAESTSECVSQTESFTNSEIHEYDAEDHVIGASLSGNDCQQDGTDNSECEGSMHINFATDDTDNGSFLGSFVHEDSNFIPRAVMMFDEEDLTVPLNSSLTSTQSPTRRCLFPESILNTNNNHQKSEMITNHGSHESDSDSCSDCEVEQCKQTAEAVTKPEHGQSDNISCSDYEAEQCKQTVESPKWKSVPENDSVTSITAGSSVGTLSTHSKVQGSDDPYRSLQNTRSCEVEPKLLHCNSLESPASGMGTANWGDAPLKTTNHHDHQYQESHNHEKHLTSSYLYEHKYDKIPKPFQHLQMLCLSSANIYHWHHLKAFSYFPKLTNIRLKNNPLYSSVHPDDRRKLYIASLPEISILNGSEISHMEREKAERHYLRYFMDKEEKPEFYHTLVKKHGPPVKLVDIDLSVGYQEWADLKFVCKGVEKFSRRVHLVEPVGKLRLLISQALRLPRSCFLMYHYSCGPSHPESEKELVELRCENLPMSRFDFADGDEIHIDVSD